MSTVETNRSWTHFRVDRRNPRYCHVTCSPRIVTGLDCLSSAARSTGKTQAQVLSEQD